MARNSADIFRLRSFSCIQSLRFIFLGCAPLWRRSMTARFCLPIATKTAGREPPSHRKLPLYCRQFSPSGNGRQQHPESAAGCDSRPFRPVPTPGRWTVILLRALLSCIAPVVLGLAILKLSARHLRLSRGLYWTIAIGLGCGADSLIFFWFRRAFVTVEWLAVIASLFLLWHRQEWQKPASGSEVARDGQWALRATLWPASFIALVYFVQSAAELLHGGWDGWGIWNLHARVLVRGGSGWMP